LRVAAALLLVELSGAALASAATLTEGRSAYDLNKVAEAEKIYAAVSADASATNADRAGARRELARIAWLVDGDAKRALDHLEAAKVIGDKPCDTADMRARVLRESHQFAEAAAEGLALLAACTDPGGKDGVRTHLIAARLDQADSEPRRRSALLAEARSETAKFSPDADIEAARVKLETALLTGDPAAALAAWKDYFWLEQTDAPQAFAKAGVTATFTDGLKAGATAEAQLRLAELLMRTGFATPSKRFAHAAGLDRNGAATATPVWKRLDAYWREREKLEAKLLRINRGLARGKADGGETLQSAKDFTAALMAAAGAAGDPKQALQAHYNLLGTAGATNGYPSIHGGHLIEDHPDAVTQYGKTARIHFVAIDNLIANGFTSWLWDGSATVGGWTADGVIVHIRPGYVQSPLRAYNQSRDSEARRTLIARERRLATEDLAKLKARPIASLDGLNDRLQLQLVDRVAAVAHTQAADEAGFRRAFLAEYSRANLDQSIIKHEGRHAIDESLGITGKVEQSVLEYQAKLSELALTDYPRMALRNMNRALEGDGPHDRAGAKIFDEYRNWIEAHPDQVIGYDPALPALVQLDKLTDGQLREIARGLDPLPNGRPSPAKL
jgi:hypothetical protein